MEKINSLLTILLLGIAVLGWGAFGIQTVNLSINRARLVKIESEFAAAQNREQQIESIIRRADQIISESEDTISGITRRIRAVEESYYEMAKLVLGNSDNSSYVDYSDSDGEN